MRVTVRLFAGLREHAGTGRRDVDLGDGARVEDVWRALELGDEPAGLVFAVNRAYVGRGQALTEGDEVALIPPVSGGAFRLTEDPIDLAAVVAEVEDERAGAVATFVGTVRAQSRGRQVVRLEYEAYEGMAENVMGELATQLEKRYDLCAIAITHRVGVCEIGDASVVIAVSAPHRGDSREMRPGR
jgi:molybdopterin synthase catalytic subunit/molybdopterin converting factor small subunit